MPKDDAPLKPPENDSSQQTLDTCTPSVTPDISFIEAAHQPGAPKLLSTFSPGDLIAKRFRIERFLAHGGMGEVYEALDIELKQKVALKTVRSVLLADVQALERFRQEIVIAKRVTHPNVCRTYDLFRHESTKPGESDVLVVSMELLSGQTLDQFLRQKGKLSTEEALPLIKQMVAGLSAAHQAGVVHRDFKASNVLLVPPPSGSGSLRVVVTDFGLAHSLDTGEFALTRTGEMLGTPAFMAPEQVTGKTITPATDIYALGVVMFEMLTGRLPFSGQNWRELAFKRLEEPAPSPKSIAPELDERWSRTILKCLEREPADRFQSVVEIESVLAGEAETQLRSELAFRQRRNRLLLAALGLLAVVAVGIVIGIAFPSLFPWRGSPTITVIGFKNVSGDKSYDPWGDQFRISLGARLSAKPIIYKPPSSMSNSWTVSAPSEMPEEPSKELLQKLHNFGCRYVIYGAYDVAGAAGSRKIAWDINLLDLDDGTRDSFHKDVMEADRQSAASFVAAAVRKSLRLPATKETTPTLTDTFDDATSTGLRKMENFDFDGARLDFLKALDENPSNARARSVLAEAYWKLGYEEKARQEASLAYDQAKDVSPDLKILINLRKEEYSKQWDSAADLYRTLWNAEPENAFYGLEMARNQMEGNHLEEALATLEKIKSGQTAVGVQAQADLQIAEVQERLGDNPSRLTAAQQAVKEAQVAGSQYLAVNAGIQQCLALVALGKVQEADTACANTVQQSLKLGIPSLIAHAETAQANLFRSRGQLAQELPLYQDAFNESHGAGDLRNEAGALFNLGVVQYDQGNFPEARKWWEQSLNVSLQRGGVNTNLLDARAALANLDGATGNVTAQIVGLKQVAAEAESIGDQDRLANALGNLCSTQTFAGDLNAAKPNCERALQLRRQIQNQSALARSLNDMGDFHLDSDNLAEARKNYDEALSIQEKINEAAAIRGTRRSLASLQLEQGNYRQAETDLLTLVREFGDSKDADGEAITRETLADLYLRQGRLEDAREQIDKGLELAKTSGDPSIPASLNIQAAMLLAKRGKTGAPEKLKKVERDMTAAGFMELALEAKLARLELLTGPTRKSELKAFADEAKQHGYLLLARKATAAAGA